MKVDKKVYVKDAGEAVGVLMGMIHGRMNGSKRTVYSVLMRQELDNGQKRGLRAFKK